MNVKALFASIVLLLVNQKGFAQQSQFDRWDSNGDGRLAVEELPIRIRKNFDRVDSDNDGFISRAEDSAFRRRTGAGKSALPEGTKVRRDVPYVSDGHERQKLDLYLMPKPETAGPLVVWVHGGGWRAGSKDNCPATFLLQHGYQVASVNYRLSHHATFPAQIHDCKAAIRWLKAHADELNVDPNRIGVWGASAGGHLVALLGTSGDVNALEGELGENGNSRVQAVVDYYGPTDLLKMNEHAGVLGTMDHDAADSPESKLLGGPLQQQVNLAKQASPLEYVTADDPPFLMIHGDEDPLVSVKQSQQLHAVLKAAKVQSELVVILGGKHGPFREPENLNRVKTFFDSTLQGKKSGRAAQTDP